jgi:hypothetical protein
MSSISATTAVDTTNFFGARTGRRSSDDNASIVCDAIRVSIIRTAPTRCHTATARCSARRLTARTVSSFERLLPERGLTEFALDCRIGSSNRTPSLAS